MSGPEQAQHEREKLSALLRDLRTRTGLAGSAAANAAGFSQSKLSKIENGFLLPSPDDVRALCEVYQAPRPRLREALRLVERLHEEVESARIILQRGAYRKQQQIGQIEAETRLFREFQPGYVIGLLQTPEYAAKVFAKELTTADARRAVEARIERQRVLTEGDKRFRFVLTEGALRWRVGSRELMAEQLDHIASVSQLPNVRLGVIPWSAEVDVFPGHAFHVYDERLVIVGTLTATATIRDPRDVAAYIRLFGALERLAVYDAEARQELARIHRATTHP